MNSRPVLDPDTYDAGYHVTVYGPRKGTPVDPVTGTANRPFRSLANALAWIAEVSQGSANIYAMHPVKKQLWVIEKDLDGLWRFQDAAL